MLTNTVTLSAGAYTAATQGQPGTGSYAQGAGSTAPLAGSPSSRGTVIMADPAGALYTAIGTGNLRAYVVGQDRVGHAALSNLEARWSGSS